jgi:regulator of PEP synthase PpsR (kinase-PPPase family)
LYHIYAISDGTGRTVDLAVKVTLVQFSNRETKVHLQTGISTTDEIDEIIRMASETKGLIIHSFVQHQFSEYIWYEGRINNIEVINLLGPVVNRFANFLHASPIEEPGLFSRLNKSYFRRIETTDFALKHDDGAAVDDLDSAEIVLLGVSRTFKTPLSIYLAYKGWLVANIPIVMGMPLPQSVYKLPPEKVFCLTTNASALSRLRNVRNEYLKGLANNYSSYDHVKKEIHYANSLYNSQPGWSIVKVTAKPIEEIASNIIRIYRRKQQEYIENEELNDF